MGKEEYSRERKYSQDQGKRKIVWGKEV